MDRTPTKAQLRWQPDQHAVAAVLAVPKSFIPMTDMNDMDRAWLVAGLTLAGLTAEDIAERTSCSRRLVMTIRAHPATMVAAAAREENVTLERDLCAERSQHANTRRELAEAHRREAKMRQQLDQLLDKLIVGEKITAFACGCPRVPYNMYRNGGRVYCRHHRSKRQAERRAAEKKDD